MSINAISNMNFGSITAVSSAKKPLSEETIKKLKELGIDAEKANIKTEAQAQKVIAQAEVEKTKQAQNAQPQQSQEQAPSTSDVLKDAQALGAKVGVQVSSMQNINAAIDNMQTKIDKMGKTDTGLNKGQTVEFNKQDLQVALNDIKASLQKMNKAKNAMFAGQDMISIMNKLSLGL